MMLTADMEHGSSIWDARSALMERDATSGAVDPTRRHIGYPSHFDSATGAGVVAGLVDTSFSSSLLDLRGASLARWSGNVHPSSGPDLREHGTHSVSLLVGQGSHLFRGLAPGARLLVASVIGPTGLAEPRVVADALDWLVRQGAVIIVIPLGDSEEQPVITAAIERVARSGAVLFAAAGNAYPDAVLFPARLPGVLSVRAADRVSWVVPKPSRMSCPDLVAPGSRISALVREGVISARSGSSVASVVAAGLAILALSARRSPASRTSRDEVLALLRDDPHLTWLQKNALD